MFPRKIVYLGLAAALCCIGCRQAPSSEGAEASTVAQDSAIAQGSAVAPAAGVPERLEWFRDAKFGMFIHWGIYSELAGIYGDKTDGGEWMMSKIGRAHV